MSLKSERAFNVILISFDTLRGDYLGCYGYPKSVSPYLDQLAERGIIFKDVRVNCGWTLPQHITMITGTHPLKHKCIYLRRRCSIPRSITTLAENFAKKGYRTFGFANANGYGGGWQYGFWRGMHHYTTIFPYNNMMELLPEAVAWVFRMSASTPFFIYIHTNDTHEPFAASQPFGSKWGTKYVNRYEGEISYVDNYFGEILKELKKRELDRRTLIVATSDHGTEFQEHSFQEKKLNLYEEISRVPLILSLPSVLPQGKRVNGLCETIDIAPTILDICSLPIPEWIDGKSLLKRISGKTKPSEFVIAHTLHEVIYYYEHFSITNGQYKFIRTTPLCKNPLKLPKEIGKRFKRLSSVANLKDGVWRELYNLEKDPLEKENIISSHSSIAHRLETILDNYINSFKYTPKTSKMYLPSGNNNRK